MPRLPKPANTATGKEAPPAGGASAMAGLEIGLRLVVGVLVCGALGFALDTWLGSLPWLMLLGGVLGFVSWLVAVARKERGTR